MSRLKRPWSFQHRRIKGTGGIDNFHPKAKEAAYNRLAILTVYHAELKDGKWSKNKWRLINHIVQSYNSGIFNHELFKNPRSISRSTLYGWDKLFREGGLKALIPHYRWKHASRATIIPIKPFARVKPLIISGHPRTRGKKNFQYELREKWRLALAIKPEDPVPILDCPIQVTIFYSMPIPTATKMPQRMKMLRQQICHVGKPELEALNSFVIDCLEGIVFQAHSQIIRFHSEKNYEWYPQTAILVRALPG